MTNGIVPSPQKRLLLFDGHALAFHSWFTSYPNEVMPGFFGMVGSAIERHGPTHVIVTFDPPPPTFRHKLYPDYKANRPPVPEGLLEDCERVRERLESLDVIFCTVEGYEADDVLGTLSSRASMAGFQTMILTSDLDLLQLVSPITEVEVFSQRYERGSVLVTSNLPFDEWTEVFGSERLTGALLDRLTHHVDILEMNGDSYRLKHSRKSNQPLATA